jgi:hypothetical protein
MTSHAVPNIAVLGMLTFAACAGGVSPAHAQAADPCAGLHPLGLFVEGQPVDEFVANLRGNAQQAEAFLRNPPPNGLGIDVPTDDLYALVQQFQEDPRRVLAVPDVLQGIAGLPSLVLLQRLLPLNLSQPAVADKVIYGKIRDYIYPGEGQDWHVSVDICFDEKGFVPLGEDRREFYHWDVDIKDAASGVRERQPPSDPSDPATYGDPFPGLDFNFPAEAIDPANPGSIWRRGLDHKLNAKGTGITIRNVYYRKLSEPTLSRLPDNHPLYASTDASCVDLFTPGPPPGTFGQLVGNDYCLGRCAHPAIFNTGG